MAWHLPVSPAWMQRYLTETLRALPGLDAAELSRAMWACIMNEVRPEQMWMDAARAQALVALRAEKDPPPPRGGAEPADRLQLPGVHVGARSPRSFSHMCVVEGSGLRSLVTCVSWRVWGFSHMCVCVTCVTNEGCSLE